MKHTTNCIICGETFDIDKIDLHEEIKHPGYVSKDRLKKFKSFSSNLL